MLQSAFLLALLCVPARAELLTACPLQKANWTLEELQAVRDVIGTGTSSEMARRAMEHLQSLPLTPGQKAVQWERFAQVISANRVGKDEGRWSSTSLGSHHGWYFYKGAISNVLAISPEGVLYFTKTDFLGNPSNPNWKPAMHQFKRVESAN